MHAIRQQDDEHLTIGIDPDRRAGKTGVTVCALGEVLARAVIAIGGVPPESAVSRGSASEETNGRIGDDLYSVI